MLKEKLNKLDTKVEYIKKENLFILRKYIPSVLAHDKIENHFEDDILSIDNGKRELAYVEIYGKWWFVCYKWIPKWGNLDYNIWKCMDEKFMGDHELFSIPIDEYDDEQTKKGRLALEAIGFETGNVKGFWIPEVVEQILQSSFTTEKGYNDTFIKKHTEYHNHPWTEDFYCKICKWQSDEKTNSIWKEKGYCKECYDKYYPQTQKNKS